MIKKYDVIVVGAGIGGMIAAGLLSKKKRVLLLEKNNKLGGYCSDFKRNDYKFESSVQAINGLYDKNPVYNILNKVGALKGVEIISPQNLYRAIFNDYDIKVPQRDICRYKEILFFHFPKEKNNIINLFDTMKSIFMEMHRFHVEKTLRKSPYLIKYAKKTFENLLDEFIDNRKLKAIISQYWVLRGLPPNKFSAITFAFIWYDYTVNGSFFPKNGMGDLIKNIEERLKENGGEVMRLAEAAKILIKDNKAKEVMLANGDRFEAKYFVSNIDVVKTFEMIESDGRNEIKNFLQKIQKNTISISAFKIYLGLSIDIRGLGIYDYEIFVNSEYNINNMYNASIANDFNKTGYVITIYSNIGDSFCKSGNSAISISVFSNYDFWKKLSRSEYLIKKNEMADIILKRCEKIIPGLQKHIILKIIATPLTMERYTGNSRGAIYGWNSSSLIEEINYLNPTTPIKNLLLASHWTKMGGGIGGTSLSADKVYSLISAED